MFIPSPPVRRTGGRGIPIEPGLTILAKIPKFGYSASQLLMPIRRISLTDELDRFITQRVFIGRYKNVSEVVCAALRCFEREEKQYEAKLSVLQTAIDEGDASGIAEEDVFARVREKLRIDSR